MNKITTITLIQGSDLFLKFNVITIFKNLKILANFYDKTFYCFCLKCVFQFFFFGETCFLQINWRTVLWGYSFQFGAALLLLRWETGRAVIEFVSSRMIKFISYSYTGGSQFVFGWLWNPPEICGMGPVLAFEVHNLCALFYFNLKNS